MNGTHPLVSVIIVNYNTPELTAALIESIRLHSAGATYEIIVIDNGSKLSRRFVADPTDAVIRTIQSETNLGFAGAANLAAGKSSGVFLLFANSDCLVVSNVLTVMAVYLQQNAACGACSPRLIRRDGTVHSSIRRFPDHDNIRRARGSIFGTDSSYTLTADTSRKPVDAMAATFMMVKRDLFEQLGGFDERFFMYVEDTDLCKRLHDAGMQVVYLGDLTVVHDWGASTRLHPWRMKLEHHISIGKYFRKHYAHRRLANAFLTLQLAINYCLVAVKMLFIPSAR